VGEVHEALPKVPSALRHYDCRNNAMSLAALEPLMDRIEDTRRAVSAERMGVVFGTSTSGVHDAEGAIRHREKTGELSTSFYYDQLEFGGVAGFVARLLDLRGPTYAISTACSSGARALASARSLIELGICDVILGNRIRTRQEALAGGMPRMKYFANRGLTMIENLLSGQNLGEWHSGFRAYNRRVLESLPYDRNSDDFVFDSQFLVQCVHFGFKLGDTPVPVRYFDEASSINFRRSTTYALQTLRTFMQWYLHRMGLKNSLFEPLEERPPVAPGASGAQGTEVSSRAS